MAAAEGRRAESEGGQSWGGIFSIEQPARRGRRRLQPDLLQRHLQRPKDSDTEQAMHGLLQEANKILKGLFTSADGLLRPRQGAQVLALSFNCKDPPVGGRWLLRLQVTYLGAPQLDCRWQTPTQ